MKTETINNLKKILALILGIVVGAVISAYFVDHFIVIAIVLFLSVVTIYAFSLVQAKKARKALESQKGFYELEMNMMKGSLNPHFLFNAINSITYSINKNDIDTASKNLGSLSKMMRTSLSDIGVFGHELSEEVAFVKNYLTLEKFRFDKQFDFTVKQMPYVNDMARVPAFCIFCFVENALKKGILPTGEPGKIALLIDEDKNSNSLVISVSDDAPARDLKATDDPNIPMINDLIDRLNAINDEKISVRHAADSKQRGNVTELRIPLDFIYSLTPVTK